MVAHLLPATKHPIRSLRAVTPYFTRYLRRRKEFVLAAKPDILKHLAKVDQKVWRQYQTHLKRTTPLERAEFYARQMKDRGLRSYAALAGFLGEPVNRIARHLKLLELPEPVRDFLRDHRGPEFVRYFTEPRLGDLATLPDPRTVWRRFREMVAEAGKEAGIWKAPVP